MHMDKSRDYSMSENIVTKKRTNTVLTLDKKVGGKKPLSIKIDHDLHERLLVARHVAKEENTKFNVSLHLEKHLGVILDMIESQLEYNPSDYEVDGKNITKK